MKNGASPSKKKPQRQAAKLEKLLKRYSPDLVKLHGDIEKHPRKESYTFTVNLSLPTGTLHATGRGIRRRRQRENGVRRNRHAVQETPGPAAQGLRVEAKAPPRPHPGLRVRPKTVLTNVRPVRRVGRASASLSRCPMANERNIETANTTRKVEVSPSRIAKISGLYAGM